MSLVQSLGGVGMYKRWVTLLFLVVLICVTSVLCLVWFGTGITRAEMQPNTAKPIIDKMRRAETAAISLATVAALGAAFIIYGLIAPFTKRLGGYLHLVVAFGTSLLFSVVGFIVCVVLNAQNVKFVTALYDRVLAVVDRI